MSEGLLRSDTGSLLASERVPSSAVAVRVRWALEVLTDGVATTGHGNCKTFGFTEVSLQLRRPGDGVAKVTSSLRETCVRS